MSENKQKPPKLIWSIPIFMGLLGGILMYIAVKDQNQEMANDGILVGVLSTIAWVFLYFMLFIFIGISSMNMMNF
ncbi:MAG TPA: hypothetical protein VIH04_02200 [Nitrosarchaeum sp.]